LMQHHENEENGYHKITIFFLRSHGNLQAVS
jgi:hypothetical protein